MSIARLVAGPLDGQVIPLDAVVDDAYIVPYGEGQLVYRRQAEAADTGDGPATVTFVYVESTEDIAPGDDDNEPW